MSNTPTQAELEERALAGGPLNQGEAAARAHFAAMAEAIEAARLANAAPPAETPAAPAPAMAPAPKAPPAPAPAPAPPKDEVTTNG